MSWRRPASARRGFTATATNGSHREGELKLRENPPSFYGQHFTLSVTAAATAPTVASTRIASAGTASRWRIWASCRTLKDSSLLESEKKEGNNKEVKGEEKTLFLFSALPSIEQVPFSRFLPFSVHGVEMLFGLPKSREHAFIKGGMVKYDS